MLFATEEKLFFKIPSLQKILKPQPHNRHDNDSETRDRKRLDNTTDRTPACNKGFAKERANG
jgi:hypothetical protein